MQMSELNIGIDFDPHKYADCPLSIFFTCFTCFHWQNGVAASELSTNFFKLSTHHYTMQLPSPLLKINIYDHLCD